eukprot:366548-Chlamydomonas_euryale.AAC.4
MTYTTPVKGSCRGGEGTGHGGRQGQRTMAGTGHGGRPGQRTMAGTGHGGRPGQQTMAGTGHGGRPGQRTMAGTGHGSRGQARAADHGRYRAWGQATAAKHVRSSARAQVRAASPHLKFSFGRASDDKVPLKNVALQCTNRAAMHAGVWSLERYWHEQKLRLPEPGALKAV